ncbi:EamA family transporter [Mesorhizobium sp. PL10]
MSWLGGDQQWLFLWAPLNNAALEVSLGYFLLPLVMVLAGLVVYREKLSLFQTLAVCSAAIGVAHEFWRMGSLSWETAVVALGMPAYFILRRALGTSNLGGFWFDVMLMFPAAVLVIVTASNPLVYFATTPKLLYLLPGLAILSALAFASFILASWYLPLSIFGLLGYLEPVLLFLVALAIGEALRPSDLFTYVPVILAVGILSLEGARHLIRQNESNIERKDARLDEVRE